MRRIAILALALLVALALVAAAGDVRVAADGSATLVSGSSGARAIDFASADDTTTVYLFNRDAGDSVVFYIPDGQPRSIEAMRDCGWTDIDSLRWDMGAAATNFVYTPIR